MTYNKNHKDLSIIVPVFNVEKYLKRCIDSLYRQGLKTGSFEIIIVNDGSSDNSLYIAKRLQDVYDDIIIYSQSNQGLAAARNTGLVHANGDYIIFVDSDDWLLDNTMKDVLFIAEKYSLDICGYRFKEITDLGDSRLTAIQPFNPKKIISGEDAILGNVNIASACSNMYKKSFIDNNNLHFTKGMTHEDVDFNIRAYSLAKSIMFTDIVSYVYFYNTESLNRSKDEAKVKKYLFDNIKVASNMKSFSKINSLSPKIQELLSKRANSTIISDLISILKHIYKPEWLDEYILLAHEEGIYPIHGKSLSWKTTLLIPFLNIPHLCHIINKL